MLTWEALQKAIPKGVEFESSETIGVNPRRRTKNLPKELWAEAVACAVYLSNRSPTRSVWGMTPQEAWSGRKPGIAHLRVFGSKAYAHVPDQTKCKLDDKSKPFIFIGYDSNTKGYKLYDPTSQKTMISRDVEFDEEGVWDFGSDNDTTSIPPFGDPRIDEQIRDEQQEQTTPPASPATSVRRSYLILLIC
ncbi:hypothetical protein SASPL_136789 [Salvia splendens]|uniref:Retroviral polymerase SH3-like domain-containing protein n=1 Tax=Salvia splendens TaxID=180675 RepID=A0A8X8X2D4_SALSN|nr:hypothetical protein SASPL_136789 [Salvia splendens]